MRKAMECQQRLDCQPVVNVKLNLACRDEIIPILASLQHIYAQPKLRDDILRAVGADVNANSSRKRGRRGMDYWPLLVLAAVRLGCNLDYDKLQDLAEQHRNLRQIMGIGDWEEQACFDWRRIQDNVTLIRPQTLERINQLIVGEGHRLVPQAAQKVRADSFVMGTNIRYPTESGLILDGLRKVLQIGAEIADLLGLGGWRQHKHLYRKAKRLVREVARLAARKGEGYKTRMQALYRELLKQAAVVLDRADELQQQPSAQDGLNLDVLALMAQMNNFAQLTRQVCGTAKRRVLEEQTVPNSEKLFSIFETHTQLYKRGKTAEPVQFGRQALVYEDAAGFIVHAHLLPRDVNDADVVVEQTRALQKRLGGRIRQASFDRGFHTPENQLALAKIIPHPCLPKPGATQAAEQEREATVQFHQSRQRHPGIESAINALQAGNGLERCRDRTETGFSRYLQLGVLGRNLHVLGKILLARQEPGCQAAQSRRQRLAA
jgi:IS5 family transposase